MTWCTTYHLAYLLTVFVQPHNVIPKAGASSGHHHTGLHVLAQFLTELRCLQCKLSCWDHHQSCKNTSGHHEFSFQYTVEPQSHTVHNVAMHGVGTKFHLMHSRIRGTVPTVQGGKNRLPSHYWTTSNSEAKHNTNAIV